MLFEMNEDTTVTLVLENAEPMRLVLTTIYVLCTYEEWRQLFEQVQYLNLCCYLSEGRTMQAAVNKQMIYSVHSW